MRITRANITNVTVEIVREIKVEAKYRLSSSYTFAGIDSGIVKVLGLNKKGDTTEVDSAIIAWLDSSPEPDLADYNRMIEKDIWVSYKYDADSTEGLYDVMFLPLTEFVDHMSTP